MDLKVWNQQRDVYMFHNNYQELTVGSDMHCLLVEKSDVSVFNQGEPHFVVMVCNLMIDTFGIKCSKHVIYIEEICFVAASIQWER